MTELPNSFATLQPRAKGEVRARFDVRSGTTRLAGLRQSGSMRALFPRTQSATPQLVLTNTSGGVTGGDRFKTGVEVADGAQVTITTQTAERAYKAQPGETGRIVTTLTVGSDSRINWVPQETILFDGCAFQRRLTLDIAPGGSALLVEPLIFGRSAMGERLTRGLFDDRIEIRSGADLKFLDRTRLDGNIAATLDRPAMTQGGLAAALVVFVHPAAETRLDPVRHLLPETAGASLIDSDLLVARLVAEDAFMLRKTLMPLIAGLLDDTLPRPWIL